MMLVLMFSILYIWLTITGWAVTYVLHLLTVQDIPEVRSSFQRIPNIYDCSKSYFSYHFVLHFLGLKGIPAEIKIPALIQRWLVYPANLSSLVKWIFLRIFVVSWLNENNLGLNTANFLFSFHSVHWKKVVFRFF